MSESARRSTLDENLPTSTSHCPEQQEVDEKG
jgi:hypothetical protein